MCRELSMEIGVEAKKFDLSGRLPQLLDAAALFSQFPGYAGKIYTVVEYIED
jgi:hypothetical protein